MTWIIVAALAAIIAWRRGWFDQFLKPAPANGQTTSPGSPVPPLKPILPRLLRELDDAEEAKKLQERIEALTGKLVTKP